MQRRMFLGSAGVLLAPAVPAQAQAALPSGPVRLFVGFSARRRHRRC